MSNYTAGEAYTLESCTAALETLLQGTAALDVELTLEQKRQFAQYCYFLLNENTKTNLTAVRTPEGVMRHLFLDSLTLTRSVRSNFGLSPSKSLKLVDVGSGAGIPGMPLKLVYPSSSVTLVESIGKKARFLDNLIEILGVTGVHSVNQRAEFAALDTNLRDKADICTARAVAPLVTLIELCAPFVLPGGLLLFPKSGDLDTEIDAAQSACLQLNVRMESVNLIEEELGLGENRSIVAYRKLLPTPNLFPRRVGLARSSLIGTGSIKRRSKFVKEERSKN
ncbi:MAG: 16S rRNA (guanine(527)-N(7))-methyltransferase RsmG [Chloroflexota bacterium]